MDICNGLQEIHRLLIKEEKLGEAYKLLVKLIAETQVVTQILNDESDSKELQWLMAYIIDLMQKVVDDIPDYYTSFYVQKTEDAQLKDPQMVYSVVKDGRTKVQWNTILNDLNSNGMLQLEANKSSQSETEISLKLEKLTNAKESLIKSVYQFADEEFTMSDLGDDEIQKVRSDFSISRYNEVQTYYNWESEHNERKRKYCELEVKKSVGIQHLEDVIKRLTESESKTDGNLEVGDKVGEGSDDESDASTVIGNTIEEEKGEESDTSGGLTDKGDNNSSDEDSEQDTLLLGSFTETELEAEKEKDLRRKQLEREIEEEWKNREPEAQLPSEDELSGEELDQN